MKKVNEQNLLQSFMPCACAVLSFNISFMYSNRVPLLSRYINNITVMQISCCFINHI